MSAPTLSNKTPAGVRCKRRVNPCSRPANRPAFFLGSSVAGREHPDLATDLNSLALLYHAQGHYAEAEPLYKRALAIQEKALGPDHSSVAISLENYAALFRKTGRGDLATMMELRAKAIRAKHAEANPVE